MSTNPRSAAWDPDAMAICRVLRDAMRACHAAVGGRGWARIIGDMLSVQREGMVREDLAALDEEEEAQMSRMSTGQVSAFAHLEGWLRGAKRRCGIQMPIYLSDRVVAVQVDPHDCPECRQSPPPGPFVIAVAFHEGVPGVVPCFSDVHDLGDVGEKEIEYLHDADWVIEFCRMAANPPPAATPPVF